VPTPSPLIVFDRVSLWVQDRRFLHEVELSVREGETLVVASPPGSGKSFFLRLALGLPGMQRTDEVRYQGDVTAAGTSLLEGDSGFLQQWRRQVGSVLRGGGLIDNMDVRRNITLPLYYHFTDIMSEAQIEARCSTLMADLGIEPLDQPGRRPVSLNVEQRIYVALARALINEPCLLLLDDPAAGLGSEATERLMPFLFHRPDFEDGISVHDRTGQPVTRLITTTDLATYLEQGDRFAVLFDQELRVLGDRQAVLQKGILRQEKGPESIPAEPMKQEEQT